MSPLALFVSYYQPVWGEDPEPSAKKDEGLLISSDSGALPSEKAKAALEPKGTDVPPERIPSRVSLKPSPFAESR